MTPGPAVHSVIQRVAGNSRSPRQDRLIQGIEEFYTLIDAGQSPDRQKLLEKYTDVAEELGECIENVDFIQNVAPQLASAAGIDSDGVDSVETRPLSLGDFRIIREIGRGGMGVVYEAEQLSVGRRVALKVLPFAAMLRSQQLERFRNEVRAAGSLTHPNIVAIYSVGSERGVHYYAMQLVEGHSLAEVIFQLQRDENVGASPSRPDVPLDTDAETQPIAALSTARLTRPEQYWRTMARLGQQAAEALDHAHRCGVVHRDVKPANLLLGGDEHLWVADFGLARLGEDAGMTMSGDVIGTLRYMSPEQASGSRSVDHRSDIYSLGATLYELLTLRAAHPADSRQQLLQEVIHGSPVPLRKLERRLPTEFETIVGKAMEKDPADRYATAGALADDLKALVEGRTITARPPTIMNHLQKWARQHLTAVAGALLALMLAAIGLTIATVFVTRNTKRAEDNLQLALSALEEMLMAQQRGELAGEPNTPTGKELLRRGIRFYEDLAARNDVDPNSWPTYRLLTLKRPPFIEGNTASNEATERAHRDYIYQTEQLVAMRDGDPRYLARLVLANDQFAAYLAQCGNYSAAFDSFDRAERLIQRLLSEHPDYSPNDLLRGTNLYQRSAYLSIQGNLAEGERLATDALLYLNQAHASDPSNRFTVRTLAMCHYNLGNLGMLRGDNASATEHYMSSLEHWRTLVAGSPENSEYHSRMGAVLSNLAVFARDDEDFSECRRLAEEAIVSQKRALELTPVYPPAKEFLRIHFRHLATALSKLGDSLALAKVAEELATEFSDMPGECCAAAVSYSECVRLVLANTQLARDFRQEQADEYELRAFEILEVCRQGVESPDHKRKVGDAYLETGDQFKAAKRPQQARQAWKSALAIFEGLRGTALPPKHGPLISQRKRQEDVELSLDEILAGIKTRLSDLDPADVDQK